MNFRLVPTALYVLPLLAIALTGCGGSGSSSASGTASTLPGTYSGNFTDSAGNPGTATLQVGNQATNGTFQLTGTATGLSGTTYAFTGTVLANYSSTITITPSGSAPFTATGTFGFYGDSTVSAGYVNGTGTPALDLVMVDNPRALAGGTPDEGFYVGSISETSPDQVAFEIQPNGNVVGVLLTLGSGPKFEPLTGTATSTTITLQTASLSFTGSSVLSNGTLSGQVTDNAGNSITMIAHLF